MEMAILHLVVPRIGSPLSASATGMENGRAGIRYSLHGLFKRPSGSSLLALIILVGRMDRCHLPENCQIGRIASVAVTAVGINSGGRRKAL
jgi:hypothetical protein